MLKFNVFVYKLHAMNMVINKISESNKGNLQQEFLWISIASFLLYIYKLIVYISKQGIASVLPNLSHRAFVKIFYILIIIALFLFAFSSYTVWVLLFRILLIAFALSILNFQDNDNFFIAIKEFYKKDAILSNILSFASITSDIVLFFAQLFFIIACKVILFLIFVAINKYFIKPHCLKSDIFYYISGFLFILTFVISNHKIIIDKSQFAYLFFPSFLNDLYRNKKFPEKKGKDLFFYGIENLLDFSMNIFVLYQVYKGITIDINNHKNMKIKQKIIKIPDSFKLI